MMLQIAICDDEQEYLTQIQSELEVCLNSHDINYNITAFHSGKELLEDDKEYQLFLLDISLQEEVNGIDIGCELHNRNRFAQIIYITSYEEYCLQAMNQAHSFAYLDKPITREKLENHVLGAIELVQNNLEQKENRSISFEILNMDDAAQVKTSYKKI